MDSKQTYEKTTITILGCGGSQGVPSIAYGFSGIDPNNPKNIRTRTSAFIEQGEKRLLIDSSMDFRQQALKERLPDFKDVLYTHEHIDHIGGFEDLRGIMEMPIAHGEKSHEMNIHGSKESIHEISHMFHFAMKSRRTGKERIKTHTIEENAPFTVAGFEILATKVDHGSTVYPLAFRFKDFAYSTDIKELNDENIDVFKGVKVWVVSCLSEKESPYHAPLKKVLNWIERVNPERAYLTHMRGDMDYERLCEKLPPHIRPCYDGLKIEV